MGREDPQLKLRLSEELKHHVTQAARRNNRSVNAEIVSVLEQFYIDKTFAEALERRAVEIEFKRKEDSTEAVKDRLGTIEGKLDQLIAGLGK